MTKKRRITLLILTAIGLFLTGAYSISYMTYWIRLRPLLENMFILFIYSLVDFLSFLAMLVYLVFLPKYKKILNIMFLIPLFHSISKFGYFLTDEFIFGDYDGNIIGYWKDIFENINYINISTIIYNVLPFAYLVLAIILVVKGKNMPTLRTILILAIISLNAFVLINNCIDNYYHYGITILRYFYYIILDDMRIYNNNLSYCIVPLYTFLTYVILAFVLISDNRLVAIRRPIKQKRIDSSPEYTLIQLNADYKSGKITEDEYNAKREDVLSKL